jgi:methylmalonyl-CoA mutase N-terminal domain/subunit
LRTQQIIAAESGVVNTVDPVAGSYAIETLTNDIERGAVQLLDRIDKAGGTLAAIESGFIQREIQESAYRSQVAVDSGEFVVVGVNRFVDAVNGASRSAPLFRLDPEGERLQIERVRALKSRRSGPVWASAIAVVTDAAASGANLVPAIIRAVEAYATVGEIADAMRSVFGTYQEAATL